jgi:hypothetical protein
MYEGDVDATKFCNGVISVSEQADHRKGSRSSHKAALITARGGSQLYDSRHIPRGRSINAGAGWTRSPSPSGCPAPELLLKNRGCLALERSQFVTDKITMPLRHRTTFQVGLQHTQVLKEQVCAYHNVYNILLRVRWSTL